MLNHEKQLRFCKARRGAIAREFPRLNPEQCKAALATEGPLLPTDRELVWEGLYNMLSLYGQLDWRGEAAEDTLLLPAETVNDYAAALSTSLEGLGALPASLEDRLTFEPGKNAFRAVCGEDGLSQIQVDSQEKTAEGLLLTGALVYLPDGSDLVRFQALLQPRDNMLGCAIVELTIFEHG